MPNRRAHALRAPSSWAPTKRTARQGLTLKPATKARVTTGLRCTSPRQTQARASDAPKAKETCSGSGEHAKEESSVGRGSSVMEFLDRGPACGHSKTEERLIKRKRTVPKNSQNMSRKNKRDHTSLWIKLNVDKGFMVLLQPVFPVRTAPCNIDLLKQWILN